MPLTETQGAIWRRIAQEYHRWNPQHDRLMPVSELAPRLPEVAPEMIGDTLAQAASEHIAEVGHVDEDPCFRPLQ